MDRTFCLFEIKNQRDEDGSFSGYGSTFGNVDSYGDTIAPGAFKKTIADAKNGNAPWPAMLSQHGGNDPTPVGIWSHMPEDEHGLRLKGKLAINNKRGADIYALLKMKPRPALNGLSIGYRVRDSENHRSGSGPNGAKRTLKSVDLVECSIVTFPADKFARVSGVKAWSDEEPVVDDAALSKEWARQDWAMMQALAQRNGRSR
jgi:HK97 family phage prohead protease